MEELVMISSMVEMIKTKFLVVLAMIKSLVALDLTYFSEISEAAMVTNILETTKFTEVMALT